MSNSTLTGTACGALAGAVAGATVAYYLVKSAKKEIQYSGVGDQQSKDGSGRKYKATVADNRAKTAGQGAQWTKPVVIAPPSLELLAATLRKRLGSEEFPPEAGLTLSLESFKSGDSNLKFNWERVIGRKVVFLFDTIDMSRFFEQLSLLQALQGFAIPSGDDKGTKWKTYVGRGSYSWGRASFITVVIPWYRPCQMERTSRWQYTSDGKWTNADPKGSWLDVPTAQYYARLLCTPGSVPPLPGPSDAKDAMPLDPLWRPPLELMFVELHEEIPVTHSISDLGATVRTERFVPYFLDKFKGKRSYPGKANMYVLFPDHGAHDRYAESVKRVLSLDYDHVLFIEKSRVGEKIETKEQLNYEDGDRRGEKASFSTKDSILIIDDFTNSGSTLFNAVNLVKKLTQGGDPESVSIFVSHLVATYDPKVVEGIKEKLHKMGPSCKFFCTNSIPSTTDLLKGDPQVEVCDLSDFIADLVESKISVA